MASKPDPFEIRRELARCVPALLSCEAALPRHDELKQERDFIAAAEERGYFHPDEEEDVILRYSQYLAIRSSLVQILDDMRRHIGRTSTAWKNWPQRLPVFITAYAAGCLRNRCADHLIGLAADSPVLHKKLDEENRRFGIPRKSFTHIYNEYSRPKNMTRLLVAIDFYRRQYDAIQELKDDPQVGRVVQLLRREEPWMDLSKRDALKRRASYRWFSFLRRNRSTWKNVTNGIFEASGRAIADLRMPGIKPRGAPKRVDESDRDKLIKILRPGDVVVTRHDDALSNLFLPGYWPHAALFIGQHPEPNTLNEFQYSGEVADELCFLEAKKDGVRVRPFSETLAVDELIVLRSKLDDQDRQQVIERGLEHAGKMYDFLFDFSTSDRLVCTEVIYRSYHGTGPVQFELREVGGRLCLPAEEFLSQSFDCGFSLVAAAGLEGGGVLEGQAAFRAFERVSRPPEPAAGVPVAQASQTAS